MSVRLKIVIILSCLWPTLSCAADNYGVSPAALAVVDELVVEEGFDRQELLKVFAQARRKDSILEAIARPAEKTKPWYEYREIFLNEKREQQGVEFFNEHRATLLRAEREFGVPAEIIVAIIGVETSYGRVAGSYRVLDALSTLAFDYPPRSPFFTAELKDFLILTRDQGMDPASLMGSYAGAMGYGQFIPSSYRNYAIDFDHDGKIDIWDNPVDATSRSCTRLIHPSTRGSIASTSAALAHWRHTRRGSRSGELGRAAQAPSSAAFSLR
jgi:membrane-bound lytic murein transglycosylase B